ncbi:MAG TPA: sarcosine oxidase subunit delta [Steroidobacteraceae bacterium]|nr:sarcosine oxidase subunit delta [Steroidobacteraceae bacterium]
MLRIACPYCGTRDEPEFTYGGPAHISRPPLESDDGSWTDYLFNRTNPKGLLAERWCHSYGCGRWFNATRDTVTHEIVSVYGATEPQP